MLSDCGSSHNLNWQRSSGRASMTRWTRFASPSSSSSLQERFGSRTVIGLSRRPRLGAPREPFCLLNLLNRGLCRQRVIQAQAGIRHSLAQWRQSSVPAGKAREPRSPGVASCRRPCWSEAGSSAALSAIAGRACDNATPECQTPRRVRWVISGRAPTRTGRVVVPIPRLTYIGDPRTRYRPWG
jgi:hypothetical protein